LGNLSVRSRSPVINNPAAEVIRPGSIAVKVINHLGDEVMKVFKA
jgi:hypothetical protein